MVFHVIVHLVVGVVVGVVVGGLEFAIRRDRRQARQARQARSWKSLGVGTPVQIPSSPPRPPRHPMEAQRAQIDPSARPNSTCHSREMDETGGVLEEWERHRHLLHRRKGQRYVPMGQGA